MATVAIGDLHGNLPALDDLLTKLAPTLEASDEVVFLGDYIDGPDVAGCITRLLAFRDAVACPVVGLMGNHEQWMLRSHRDATRHSWLLGMDGLRTIRSYSPQVAQVIGQEMKAAAAALYEDRVPLSYYLFFDDAMPAEHLAFFRTLRVFHQTPDVLCVHGGCENAGGPLSEQPADVLIWGPDGFPDTYTGKQPVVYGHHNNAVLDAERWPHPRVTRHRAFGIDTTRHGILTAMRFPDQTVVQSGRFIEGPDEASPGG